MTPPKVPEHLHEYSTIFIVGTFVMSLLALSGFTNTETNQNERIQEISNWFIENSNYINVSIIGVENANNCNFKSIGYGLVEITCKLPILKGTNISTERFFNG